MKMQVEGFNDVGIDHTTLLKHTTHNHVHANNSCITMTQ